jgi:hypothetical protein
MVHLQKNWYRAFFNKYVIADKQQHYGKKPKATCATATTNLQTQASTEHKKQLKAQILQSGCAKQLFPTTTKKKNNQNRDKQKPASQALKENDYC